MEFLMMETFDGIHLWFLAFNIFIVFIAVNKMGVDQ